jgi:hypothetical protein
MDLAWLKKLAVRKPVFPELEEEENDNEEGPDCWAELVQRNKNISEVVFFDNQSPWYIIVPWGSSMVAVLHESIKTLHIE